MKYEEALSIATGLATFFDRRPWTAEKIRFFAQAIEDLPYENARKAAEQYMRDGEYAPVPRDLREISRKMVPEKRTALPSPDGEPPKIYYPEGNDYERCTAAERRTLQAQYDRMGKHTQRVLLARKVAELDRRGGKESLVEGLLRKTLARLEKLAAEAVPF